MKNRNLWERIQRSAEMRTLSKGEKIEECEIVGDCGE